MTIEPIGILVLLVGLIGMFRSPAFIIYAFMVSTLLGSAAVTNVNSVGGVSIPPAHLLLAFLTLKLLISDEIRTKTLEAVAFGKPGFWLFLTVSFSLVTAYFMPRLFQGEMFVFPVRAQGAGVVLLEPATSNLTQSVYFIADATCFFVCSGYVASRNGARVLLNAALIAAMANLVFAALDLITYSTNTAELLSFIRNANYVMLVEDQAAGFKRIVGSFPEASSFGSAALGYFALTSRLWLLGVYPRLTLPLWLLTLCSILLATSTTAYVGLAVYLTLIYLEILVRMMVSRATTQMRMFILGAPLILPVVALAIALSDSYSATARDLLDTFFFSKLSSASGQERSAWNQTALQNFFDSYGFGFGNGSGRASSFVIATLASLGMVGSALFVLFLASLFFRRNNAGKQDPIEEAARQSAKSMCLAWLITAAISDPLIELGLGFYAFAALASAQGFRQSKLHGVTAIAAPNANLTPVKSPFLS